MKDGTELYNQLRQHTGSETIFHHSLVRTFNYTEGVRDFAQSAGGGAYWLLDILATEPAITKLIKEEGFGLVILKVTGSKAVLTVAGDSDIPPVFSREIDLTDCPEAPVTKSNPEGTWKFYLEPSEVGGKPVIMCMLPQER
ncbi:hypothetical protein LP414_27525 [Polaromonas sp. P1(28)-13]|nr:hypothetical protein LP414_27525 [Polaromonas sp. P1(28)-13]